MKKISGQAEELTNGLQGPTSRIEGIMAGRLTKKTIVILLSDGWDTGNITTLENSMEVIYRKAKRLFWLNPLAGYDAFCPDTGGMRVVMPLIFLFAAVHKAESLKRFGKCL